MTGESDSNASSSGSSAFGSARNFRRAAAQISRPRSTALVDWRKSEAASFVSSSGYCELAHKPVVILLVGPPGRHQAAMPAWRGQDGKSRIGYPRSCNRY